MLAVSDGNAAIQFYGAAFGATLLWHLNGGGHVVAGLSIDGATFFLAHESPPHGTRGPASVGFTTVRIELFVDDRVLASVNSVLEPDQESEALRLARAIASGLESGRLEPTAAAASQWPDGRQSGRSVRSWPACRSRSRTPWRPGRVAPP